MRVWPLFAVSGSSLYIYRLYSDGAPLTFHRSARRGSRRGRGHIREHLHGTQAGHAYEEASYGCHLYFDLDGRSAGSVPCGILPLPRRSIDEEAGGLQISRFLIPSLVSRFTEAWHVGRFLISVG